MPAKKPEVREGSRLLLQWFGMATVKKLYTHWNAGHGQELVADVVADSGERLHLSMSYAASRLVA